MWYINSRENTRLLEPLFSATSTNLKDIAAIWLRNLGISFEKEVGLFMGCLLVLWKLGGRNVSPGCLQMDAYEMARSVSTIPFPWRQTVDINAFLAGNRTSVARDNRHSDSNPSISFLSIPPNNNVDSS